MIGIGISPVLAAFRRRAPQPMRLFTSAPSGDVVLEYGDSLPLTADLFLSQDTDTITVILEPPTFVSEASSPYPSVIVEVV